MDQPQNITDQITHPILLNVALNLETPTFHTYLLANPFPFKFHDQDHNIEASYTPLQRWRKVLANFIQLVYYVRECNHMLTAATFQPENIVFVGHNVKLRAFYGLPLQQNSNIDFFSIANFVRNNLVGQFNFPDIAKFLLVIRGTGPLSPTFRRHQIHLQCNYALMTTEHRREFLIMLQNHFRYLRSNVKLQFDNYARRYLPHDWRDQVQNLPENAALLKVFRFRREVAYDATPQSCLLFIKNSLGHLVSDHGYTATSAYNLLNAFFGNFMAAVQGIVFFECNLMDEEYLLPYKAAI